MSHPERKCSSWVQRLGDGSALSGIESTGLQIGSPGAKPVQAARAKLAARSNNEQFLRMFVDAESGLG